MILHDKEAALHFVAGILQEDPKGFGKCNGLIVVLNDGIIAAVIYHDYKVFPEASTISASIASIDKRWATRKNLRTMFSYPFEEIGVACIRTVVRRSNTKARSMNKRLGFKEEGVARKGYDGIEDAVVYSMLPDECVWIGGELKTRKQDRKYG